MERIQDLLAAAAQGEPGPALNVREDPRHGVYVAGATQLAASRWEDVLCAVASAVLERSTSSTAQNRESSRSHAVLQAHVATTRAADGPDADGMHRVTRRTLTLVDLAGSERVSKSQAKVRFWRRGHAPWMAAGNRSHGLLPTHSRACVSRSASASTAPSRPWATVWPP